RRVFDLRFKNFAAPAWGRFFVFKVKNSQLDSAISRFKALSLRLVFRQANTRTSCWNAYNVP
ncbi:MAG TPA: hypothetical protein PLS01_07110, partial [Clostridia bacterium]|nr:hypothetical protein [Clostridia bacterium]